MDRLRRHLHLAAVTNITAEKATDTPPVFRRRCTAAVDESHAVLTDTTMKTEEEEEATTTATTDTMNSISKT